MKGWAGSEERVARQPSGLGAGRSTGRNTGQNWTWALGPELPPLGHLEALLHLASALLTS